MYVRRGKFVTTLVGIMFRPKMEYLQHLLLNTSDMIYRQAQMDRVVHPLTKHVFHTNAYKLPKGVRFTPAYFDDNNELLFHPMHLPKVFVGEDGEGYVGLCIEECHVTKPVPLYPVGGMLHRHTGLGMSYTPSNDLPSSAGGYYAVLNLYSISTLTEYYSGLVTHDCEEIRHVIDRLNEVLPEKVTYRQAVEVHNDLRYFFPERYADERVGNTDDELSAFTFVSSKLFGVKS